MNRLLFRAADFLSRPPGFYAMLAAMAACTLLVPFGLTNAVTYALSVAAIIITGVVLIQGYRDTAAIHAKLDEIVIALKQTRNDVVGLEHAEPHEIKSKLMELEIEAGHLAASEALNAQEIRPVPQWVGGVGIAEAPAEGGMGTAARQR
ncbi:MAG: hypothetical protein EOR72_31785 [Mesorhizobium sp.]|jgi:low affinity Fe/Cu permease|nr:MAG: hypothetical protein EOQ84_31500 [Mesorhizobium sp.]RWL20167.1 MAG: hypothetical protein EOR58_31540 [Mesorhizobium sp.]RWL23673.1 MAG: hypothetical protein EOR63_31730 [Mesorhizobium sp.]RWL28248.1 MAG: hypothetical protein EOR59_31085 [Mesorhizobium sp.]RWL44225.1 MAG: hypothetical protein EOR61_30090 [Mesorhizobium sp.]